MGKLTNKQRIEIHKRRLKGETIASLAQEFNVNVQGIIYLLKLLDKHGYNILRDKKNRYYSPEFKEYAIKKNLIYHQSIASVASDVGLISTGILWNWIKKYKENCYNVIEKKKGRKPMTKKLKMNNKKNLTLEEKVAELEKRNLYLEAENEYLKKLSALVQEEELQSNKES